MPTHFDSKIHITQYNLHAIKIKESMLSVVVHFFNPTLRGQRKEDFYEFDQPDLHS